MRVVDSHLHLWDPELLKYPWLEGPLNGLFGEYELELAAVEGASIENFVFVQAGSIEDHYLDEVRWVTSLAPVTGVRAIVAGARLDRGIATTAHLDALLEHLLVVGVRHILQGERDGLARSSAFLAGARELAARNLSFDACISASQLPDVIALGRAVPDLRIVLDHLGKPEVGTAGAPITPSVEWVSGLSELARNPQVHCKLSGLPGEAGGDWTDEQFEPFLDAAAEAFDAGRLMWGSDWPVSVIGPAEEGDPYAPEDGSPTYQYSGRTRWARTVESWAQRRGHDADAIMWGNAVDFYRLDEVPSAPAPRKRRWFDWRRDS